MNVEAFGCLQSLKEPAAQDTMKRALIQLARRKEPVLIGPDQQLTGHEFVHRVHTIAGVLAGAGLKPGHVVALLNSPNHPDVILARYAARWVGSTVVHLRSMNPRSDEQEFPASAQIDILDRTGADFIITDPSSQQRAAELASYRPELTVVVSTDVGEPAPPSYLNRPRDCAVIDLTSGSTGNPRLVRQSHKAREALVERLAADLGTSSPRLLSVTPVTHTTAPMIDAVLLGGGSVVLHRRFDVEAVLAAIDAGVTDLYLATPHLCALLDDPRTHTMNFAHLRRLIYSGTPAAPHRVAAARKIFGDAIVQVYGTTETGGISVLTGEDHDEPLLRGTVGRPFPWAQVSIRDPETGLPLPVGTRGAIWVRSTTTADGYWQEPIDQGPDPDGWVNTGDLGCLDQHGYLRLIGRLNGVMKVGGLKIYPASIEAALREHPGVSEAVVHGIRDSERRESIHAVISPIRGVDVDTNDLMSYVTKQLSPMHTPARILVWHGVPLTQSGKTDRRFVRELLCG